MVELFIDGGSFMWPILAIFIVGLIFVGERLIHLISTLKWGEDFANDVTNKLDSSGVLDASSMCEQGSGPIANLFLCLRSMVLKFFNKLCESLLWKNNFKVLS